MKRLTLLVALLFLVGCTDPPAPVAAKKIDDTEPKLIEIPDKEAPAQSEPAAKAIVDAAIAAHTEGKPGAIEAWKSFLLVRTGTIRTNTREIVTQTWTIQASWPDGYKLQADVGGGVGIIVAMQGLVGRRCMISGAQKSPVETLEPTGADDFIKDTAGEWVWSLYPLMQPETKLTSYEPTLFQGRKLVGVRIFHPRFVPVVAYFDPETKLLAGVTYQGRENAVRVLKENFAIDMRSFAGFKFPGRLVVNANGVQLAEWNVTKMEPATFDAKFFETP